MSSKKGDLILHPVRFRILRALGTEALTTQEISARLPGIPTSSIYRHLKLLLAGDMVMIADTRFVKGIAEKRYRVAQRPYLGPNDVRGLSAADHIRYFNSYVLTLIQDYADYVEDAARSGTIDMLQDRTGYTEISFYASPAELDQLQADLNAAVIPLLDNLPGENRQRTKLAVIGHPYKKETS